MADVMQFIRELLEGQPPGTAIKGTVTHAVRIFTEEPSDPALYEVQAEIGGYVYSAIAFTRDPNLAMGIPMGIEILFSRPMLGAEGYPIFLRVDRAMAVQSPVNPHLPPEFAQNFVPPAAPPQASPVLPAPPAQPSPQPPAAPPMPEQEQLQHGVENVTEEDERASAQAPFNANQRDEERQDIA